MSGYSMLSGQLDLLSWSPGPPLMVSWTSSHPLTIWHSRKGWKDRHNSGLGPSKFLSQALEVRGRGCVIIPLWWKEMSQDLKLKWARQKVGWLASWLFNTEDLTTLQGKVNQLKEQYSLKNSKFNEFWYEHGCVIQNFPFLLLKIIQKHTQFLAYLGEETLKIYRGCQKQSNSLRSCMGESGEEPSKECYGVGGLRKEWQKYSFWS